MLKITFRNPVAKIRCYKKKMKKRSFRTFLIKKTPKKTPTITCQNPRCEIPLLENPVATKNKKRNVQNERFL